MSSIKAKRVPSPKSVVSTIKKILPELELKKFIEAIPPEAKVKILSGSNIDIEFGKYILGDSLPEFVQSDSNRRKELAKKSIIERVKENGIEIEKINTNFIKRRKSRLSILQSAIERAKNVIEKPHTLTDDFLLELKNILLEQKARLEKTRV